MFYVLTDKNCRTETIQHVLTTREPAGYRYSLDGKNVNNNIQVKYKIESTLI